jgi:hypothetical protein
VIEGARAPHSDLRLRAQLGNRRLVDRGHPQLQH